MLDQQCKQVGPDEYFSTHSYDPFQFLLCKHAYNIKINSDTSLILPEQAFGTVSHARFGIGGAH